MMWQILMWVTTLYLLLLFVGLLAPRVVLREGKRTRGQVIKVYGLGAIGALMLASMFAPDADEAKDDAQASSSNESTASSSTATTMGPDASMQKVSLNGESGASPDEALKKKLSKLNRNVQVNWVVKDENGKYRVAVTYAPSSIWSGSSFLTGLSNVVVTHGKVVRDSGLPISDLIVNGRGPVVDQYGNERSSEYLTITVPESDFTQINWKNITHWGALEIADVAFRPVGRDAAVEFCKDESNAKYAPNFCRAADTGKRKVALSAGSVRSIPVSAVDSKSVENKAIKPLNLDLTTFQKRVNNDFKAAKISYRIPADIKLEGEDTAPRKTASVSFNQHFSALVGADSKSGKLVSITAISQPNEDASNVLSDVMASILIASAAAGKDGEKLVGGEILRMFNRVMETFTSQVPSSLAKESFDKNGVRYGVMISKQLGIWIYAESI